MVTNSCQRRRAAGLGLLQQLQQLALELQPVGGKIYDGDNSCLSHALADAHSRLQVITEIPSASAVSSCDRPPKKRSTTTRAARGSTFSSTSSAGIAEITAVDAALDVLETVDPRAARVVVLRFFGGLSHEETAEVLGISVITCKREWASAKAWLKQELSTS